MNNEKTLYEMSLNQELARIDVRPVQCEDQGDAFTAVEDSFFGMYKVVEKEHLGEVFRSNGRLCMIAETDNRPLFAEKGHTLILEEARGIRKNKLDPVEMEMGNIRIAGARARRFEGDIDAGIKASEIFEADRAIARLLEDKTLELPVTLREGQKKGMLKGKISEDEKTCEFWFFPYVSKREVADEALKHWSFQAPAYFQPYSKETASKERCDFLFSFVEDDD